MSNEPYGEGKFVLFLQCTCVKFIDRDCPLSTSNSTFGQVSNAFSKGTNEIAASVIGILVMFVTVAYARYYYPYVTIYLFVFSLTTSIYLSNNKQLQKLRGNHKDESEVI